MNMFKIYRDWRTGTIREKYLESVGPRDNRARQDIGWPPLRDVYYLPNFRV